MTSVPEIGHIDASDVLQAAMTHLCGYDSTLDPTSDDSAAYEILQHLQMVVDSEAFLNAWAMKGGRK